MTIVSYEQRVSVICRQGNVADSNNKTVPHVSTIPDCWRLLLTLNLFNGNLYRGADKSLARPGRKQATATEDFEFHISYL